MSLLGPACNPAPPQPRPNVLLILADDLGGAQLGCYGGSDYSTPALDRLAAQGFRFTQAYAAAAVCSPTRAALMTGLHPARWGLTDFIAGDAFPDKALRQPDWQRFLPLAAHTLGEHLGAQGYATAYFGKWHLSPAKTPPDSRPFDPDKQGFEEYLITYKPRVGRTDPEHDPHNVDSLTDRAIQFLDRPRERPFFLVVAHNAIHDPLMESRERIAAVEARGEVGADPTLVAMVERLDDGVGRLLATLDRLDLADQTLVLFYSDNGGKAAYARQGPFRAGKGWLYEGGVRVPLIFRWPGRIPAGDSSHQVATTADLFPTLSELLGIDPPPGPLDGISLAPTLVAGAPVAARTLYWHYPHYHRGSGMRPAGAIRRGDLKLIEWFEPSLTGRAGAYELYDLATDPGEQRDLAATWPDSAAVLARALRSWRAQVGAQMPVPAR